MKLKVLSRIVKDVLLPFKKIGNGVRMVVGVMFFSEKKVQNEKAYLEGPILYGGFQVMRFFMWLAIVAIIVSLMVGKAILLFFIISFWLPLLLIVIGFIVFSGDGYDVKRIYTPPPSSSPPSSD